MSRFTHINESFACENCGRDIPPLSKGCRNHCPYCLVSKHVDENPGDRAEDCHGLMDAVDYQVGGKKGMILTFRCRRCGVTRRNRAATEDPIQADQLQAILTIKNSPLPGWR